MGRGSCSFIWSSRAGAVDNGDAGRRFGDYHHARDLWVMREQVGTREGEEDDVEQAIGKIDAVDKNCNTKWDIMVRESAIASN
jgi:hypothetical protein